MTLTAPTVTLHIGYDTRVDNTPMFDKLAARPGVAAVHADGDSWEEWGEVDDANPRQHLVIVVTGVTDDTALRDAEHLGFWYGAVASLDGHEVTWAATASDDWSAVRSTSRRPKFPPPEGTPGLLARSARLAAEWSETLDRLA